MKSNANSIISNPLLAVYSKASVRGVKTTVKSSVLELLNLQSDEQRPPYSEWIIWQHYPWTRTVFWLWKQGIRVWRVLVWLNEFSWSLGNLFLSPGPFYSTFVKFCWWLLEWNTLKTMSWRHCLPRFWLDSDLFFWLRFIYAAYFLHFSLKKHGCLVLKRDVDII